MSEPKTQFDKFKEAARDLECDDDEERFNAALKKIGEYTPEKGAKPKK